MISRLNVKTDGTGLSIVAKPNNQESYLMACELNGDVGFVCDLKKGIRFADDKVKSIRRKGTGVDIRCSANAAKRILEKSKNRTPLKRDRY
jgi:hypothetical protein